MKKTILIVLIIIIVLVGGGYLLTRTNNNDTSVTKTTPTQNSTVNNQKVAATITFSNSGFSPSVTTVKSGDTVEIKNTSSNDVQFQSDPHPIHTDDVDLNVGLVAAGQTKTFTVTKTGTFGFHNHLNPDNTGKITIQ